VPAIGAPHGGKGIRVKGDYLEEDEDGHMGQVGDEWPTEEDLVTLRKVPDRIPWASYTVAFVELCERFSYYGSTVICMSLLSSISYELLSSNINRSPEFHPKTSSQKLHYWSCRSPWSSRCAW
jgi:hypothetical protein